MVLDKASLLDIRHLRTVSAIADTKNLTRAAQKLFISQPAVSQQLKEIEQTLGITLFVRSRKEMEITRMGEEVLVAARNIFNELDEMNTRINRLENGEEGELKIGMFCPLSYQWIPGVLKKMQKSYPKVDLKIGNCHRPKKELFNKLWDVIIAAVPIDHPSLDHTTLFTDEIVLLVHPKEPVAQKESVTPGDLRGYRYLSLTSKDLDIPYKLLMTPGDAQPGAFMTVEQPEAIVTLVREGFGITIFPRWAVKSEIERKDIAAVPLTPAGVPLDWKAVYLKSMKKNPYFEDFINYCKEII